MLSYPNKLMLEDIYKHTKHFHRPGKEEPHPPFHVLAILQYTGHPSVSDLHHPAALLHFGQQENPHEHSPDPYYAEHPTIQYDNTCNTCNLKINYSKHQLPVSRLSMHNCLHVTSVNKAYNLFGSWEKGWFWKGVQTIWLNSTISCCFAVTSGGRVERFAPMVMTSGWYWKGLSTLALERQTCAPGHKSSKEYAMVMCCGSAPGNHKIKLAVTGNAKKEENMITQGCQNKLHPCLLQSERSMEGEGDFLNWFHKQFQVF